jgi:hypothetical protein
MSSAALLASRMGPGSGNLDPLECQVRHEKSKSNSSAKCWAEQFRQN